MNQALFWLSSSLVWAWTYTLGYNQMGGQANVYGAVVCLIGGLILALLCGGVLDFGPNGLWLSLILFAPFNIMIAFDLNDTALRWLFFFALLKVATSFCANKPAVFMRGFTFWLPWGLAIVMAADFYARRGGTELYSETAKGAGHAITLYATLLAAIAPFGRRFIWTLVIWAVCVGFIYLSGSRGALFSLIPIFAVALIYYTKTKKRFEASVMFAGLFAVAILGPVIFNVFAEIKVANPSKLSGWESAENSLLARIQLARNAWDLVMHEPLTGWGLGQSYNRVQGLYESASVHSVWVITILQAGIPLGFIVNFYVLSFPLRALFNNNLSTDFKWLIVSVATAYFFRATFEPITFFDLGSMWSFAHLVLFVYALNAMQLLSAPMAEESPAR